MCFLFGEVASSDGCLGWAMLFYCGTPRGFHIIILDVKHHHKQTNTLFLVHKSERFDIAAHVKKSKKYAKTIN